MATIKARVGSQNAIRVLSNASTPPTRLINLSDVNQTFSNQDGLILVWDLPTQSFICLLYTSPSPRDRTRSRMPSSA